MTSDLAAACLEALGHPLRRAICRILVRAATGGLAGSSLSHQLAVQARVGPIRRRRIGASLICTAGCTLMQHLIGYLHDECCADAGGPA